MSVINVLITIDTTSTLAGLTRVYMESDHAVDTGEGSADLTINAKMGDKIYWRAVAINLSDEVELTAFDFESGKKVIQPPKQKGDAWVTTVTALGEEDYTFTFSINGKGSYSWDPHIDIQP